MKLKKLLLIILNLLYVQNNYAFLGLSTPGILQSSSPAWTKNLYITGVAGEAKNTEFTLYAGKVAIDGSGNIVLNGKTEGGIDTNRLTSVKDYYTATYSSSGNKISINQDDDVFRSYLKDSSGNYFDFINSSTSINGLALIGSQDGYLMKYNSAKSLLWTKQIGAASANVSIFSINVDSGNNIIVTGTTNEGLDGNSKIGTLDFFVFKYDSNGNKLWSRQLGPTGSGLLLSYVKIDGADNIYVMSQTFGGLDGNSQAGSWDMAITKYNSSGVKQWTRQLGKSSKYTNGGRITFDSSNNIIITGWTSGGLDSNTMTGSVDIFVVKYNSSGVKQWTKMAGAASLAASYGLDVTADNSDNIYITGYSNGAFDGNPLIGTADAFLIKYNSSGTKQWSRTIGGSGGYTQGTAIVFGNTDNIYFISTTNVGLDGNTKSGNSDVVIANFDTAGTKKWIKQFGATSKRIETKSVIVDSSENIYLAGNAVGNLDGNTLTGTRDLFLSKFNSSGIKQWTRQLGTSGMNVDLKSMVKDAADNIYLTANLSTNGNFDGNTAIGTYDSVLIKYNSSGVKQWSRQFGGAGGVIASNAIAKDSLNNVYVAGNAYIGLNGNTLTGYPDIFLLKYNSSGTVQWTKQLGIASKAVRANAVVIDSSDNIYISGIAEAGFDGNSFVGSIFITKYDSSGNKLWTTQTGNNSGSEPMSAMAIDTNNNLIVIGKTNVALDGQTKIGNNDLYVMKFNSSGTKIWTKQFGVLGNDVLGGAVRTDNLGNIYITGQTTGGLKNNIQKGLSDLFVTKLNSLGLEQWTRQLGKTNKTSVGNQLAVNNKGDLYVVADSNGEIDFLNAVSDVDGFLIKYSGN